MDDGRYLKDTRAIFEPPICRFTAQGNNHCDLVVAIVGLSYLASAVIITGTFGRGTTVKGNKYRSQSDSNTHIPPADFQRNALTTVPSGCPSV